MVLSAGAGIILCRNTSCLDDVRVSPFYIRVVHDWWTNKWKELSLLHIVMFNYPPEVVVKKWRGKHGQGKYDLYTSGWSHLTEKRHWTEFLLKNHLSVQAEQHSQIQRLVAPGWGNLGEATRARSIALKTSNPNYTSIVLSHGLGTIIVMQKTEKSRRDGGRL